MNKKNIEILSPAGGYESVVAGVLNGANAIYLGQQNFNARQNAQNFSGEQLQEAVDYCHLHDVKVYQTLNVVVFDNEINSLIETIKIACKLKIDAFIVQDLGVLKLVKQICPDMKVNASTQMTVHTVEGAKLLKEMGFDRVVLSRELTLSEIKNIVDNVDIEVEVFAHGALCMSVSGQCYMSSMIGGRSGNKGSCAGTCRLPFTSNYDKEAYDLSLKDLCSTEVFDKLVEVGVTSLKIEGRMKRPEYVAVSTKAYADLKNSLIPNTDDLQAIFSRSGFTNGYLESKINNDMFGYRKKDDVISSTKDVLSTWKQSYHKEKQSIPVDVFFSAKNDEKAFLKVSDNKGNSVQVYGDIPQIAINKPTTGEMAKEALLKFGGSVYLPCNVDVEIGEGLIIPKSKLNEMRRNAISELDELRTNKKEIICNDVTPEIIPQRQVKNTKLRARYQRFQQFNIETVEKLEYIYMPFEEILDNEDKLKVCRSKIIIEVDRAMFTNEDIIKQKLKTLFDLGYTKLAISNIAHIHMGREIGFELFGTMFLNITNSYSLSYYQELGVKDCTLSFENTVGDINKINAINNTDSQSVGAVMYGYLPLMLVRNCPIKQHHDCATCNSSHSLTDRLGNEFKVLCNRRKYSEVLNCRVLELSDRLVEFNRCDFGILYFTVESKSQVDTVVEKYRAGAKVQGEFTRGLYYRGLSK